MMGGGIEATGLLQIMRLFGLVELGGLFIGTIRIRGGRYQSGINLGRVEVDIAVRATSKGVEEKVLLSVYF